MSEVLTPIFSRTEPWKHQREAYDFSLPKRGVLLAMKMGTGKSKVVVDLVCNRKHNLTLVLCPLSVVDVWPEQFRRHAGWPVDVIALNQDSVVQKAHVAERVQKLMSLPRVLVCNYESAWRNPLASLLLNSPIDLLVLDECHRIKNPDSRSSKFCAALAQGIPYRLGLSGTPMPHSPLDIFSQMRALEPSLFGLNYHRFKQRYAVLEPVYGADCPEEIPDDPHWRPPSPLYTKVAGYQNQEDLAEKMRRVTYQVGSEVLDLPEALHEKIPVQLGEKARNIHARLEKELKAEIDDGTVTAANALVKLLRLQQVTSGFVGTDEGHIVQIDCAKRSALADLLEDVGNDEPVVVACNFLHDLGAVHRCALMTGRKSYELSGRRKELPAWQIAAGGPVLAVQIKSGGLGVDLTRARVAVLFSLGYDLAAYEQFLARVHRPGQTRGVLYYHLVARETVDGRVYRALKAKKSVVEAVLDMVKRDDSWEE